MPAVDMLFTICHIWLPSNSCSQPHSPRTDCHMETDADIRLGPITHYILQGCNKEMSLRHDSVRCQIGVTSRNRAR